MKRVNPLWCLAAFAMIACTPQKTSYQDPNNPGTLDTDIDRTDIKLAVNKMVKAFLATEPGGWTPPWQPKGSNTKPYIAVGKVQNRTTSHVDLKILTDQIRTAMLNSGKFGFTVEKEYLEEAADDIELQQNSGFYDVVLAARKGNWIPPEYVLRGRVYSQTKQNNDVKDVYYLFVLFLDSLETGNTVWSAEKELRKVKTRATFGS